MKVISKRISRNEFVSRKNGVIPSLVDIWMLPETQLNCGGSSSYAFGTYPSAVAKMAELGLSPSLLEYEGRFIYQDHNYGLIVSDIIIPDNIASSITDYTDIYVNIPNGYGEYYDLTDPNSDYHYEGRKIMHGSKEVKILTYQTLNKWYTFFKKYKQTIKMYDNAIGLYEAEYENKNDDTRKRFSDLDDLFKARGGDTMYNWILENCMPHDNDMEVNDEFPYATYSASYTIPILLTNSIDDMGEMTVLSDKWKSGVDYSNKLRDENGTVTYYDGKTYVIKGSGSKGYYHNEYHENAFNESDWDDYTELKNPIETSCHSTYAISPVNGRVIYDTDHEDETINYVQGDFIMMNGNKVDVIDGCYVIPDYENIYGENKCTILKNRKKLQVIEDGALKYAVLNGKKFYALKDDDGVERIYFTKLGNCYDNGSIVQCGKYILYNGKLILAGSGSVVLEDDEGNKTSYVIANGYFDYKHIRFYILNGGVAKMTLEKRFSGPDESGTYALSTTFQSLTEEDLLLLGWEEVNVDAENGIVIIKHKLNTKDAKYVTGYTESQLEKVRRRKVNTDELGNELPGYFDLPLSRGGSHYNTPYNECTLDLLYKVGEASDVEYLTTVDGTKLYNGNYLESIKFYHIGENGRRIDEQSVNGTDSRTYLKKYDEGGDFYRPDTTLYCEITYYLGATLKFNGLKYVLSDKHKGVKYIETLTVTKSTGDFYMSDNSTFTFIYYELRGEMSGEELYDYNDSQLTNMAYFEMEIMRNCEGEEGNFNPNYWEEYNGLVESPVFRTEYNLFSSTPQNVKSDIYIDRGVNAAFERHLKLLEAHSFESLENFGNGYFKINEY